MSKRTRQEALYDEHCDFIEKNFSKEAYEGANIGWAQDEGSYCSKIYSDPRIYVTSTIDMEGVITHEVSSS